MPTPSWTGPWQPVHVLPVTEPVTTLDDVAIRSDGSAWAVGADVNNEAWVGRFTVRGWKRVPLDGVEGAGRAVVVDRQDHLWVFTGAPDHAPDTSRSSAAEWDGRSWRITDLGGGLGISQARAIGPEVWFLAREAGRADAPVVERRPPGGRWTDTHVPIRAEAIDGRTPSDVWAVGRDTATGRPAVARWNGRAWTRAALPRLELPQGTTALFRDVLVRGTGDVWAVGGVFADTGEEQDQPARWLIARWNGREWSVDVIGDTDFDVTGLTEIADDGQHGAWIAAHSGGLLLHADRKGRVTQRRRLDDGCQGGELTALASRPGTPALWAVGTYSSCTAGGVGRTAVYRTG